MKFIVTFLAIILMIAGNTCVQSKEVKFLLDTTIALMKSNAVNRDKVDWEKIKKNVNAQIATKENAYQLGPVYRMLFQSLMISTVDFIAGIALINGSDQNRNIRTQ